MQPPQHSTTQQIITLLPRLPEGDRIRLLRFAHAMIEQRAGKRRQRSKRFIKPAAPEPAASSNS